MSGRLAQLRARLGDERGFNLIELLTTMAIMGVVLGGLTTIFVSGSKAEAGMNRRFQAQLQTRLALDRIRRDIHCATNVSSYATNSVTLALPTGCGGDVSWCTAAVAGATTRFALYRQAGSACSSTTGTRVADYLTTGNVFTAFTAAGQTLASLTVDFPVSVKGSTTTERYELKDTIYLRNSTRT